MHATRLSRIPSPARAVSLICTILLCTAATASADDLRYRIVDLGPLPGGLQTFAYGINDLGQVVGESIVATNGNIAHSRPVVWSNGGAPSQLWQGREGYECYFDPLLQAFVCDEPVAPGARPRAINNAGTIVGQAQNNGYTGTPLPTGAIPDGTAFIWDAAQGRRLLGTLGGSNSEARAINEAGVVVGSADIRREFDLGNGPVMLNVARAFIWDEENGMRELATSSTNEEFSRGMDINAQGQVVGWTLVDGITEQAFVWSEEEGMSFLPSLGGSAFALSINDAGSAVGFSEQGSGVPRAVIWSASGDIHELGTLPGDHSSRAFSINIHGRVIGHSQPPGGWHAFIWDAEFGMRALENLLLFDAGWSELEVRAINDFNEITGYGRIDGNVHAFVMVPVPEPTSLSLAAISAAFAVITLVSRRVRRHRRTNYEVKGR